MDPFLKELAAKVVREHTQLDQLTFVFPNRRAALYFQSYLAQGVDKPKWAPTLFSIEEFFKRQSDLQEPDRLTLIHKLYQVYTKVINREEPFDRFYFWGEMLLRDFDELDKYLVNAPQLFRDLSKLKELDETFDYLTEEQKKFLLGFWGHFETKKSETKEEFLSLWNKLPKVYTEYSKSLRKEGLGYEGMIHRDVAEKWLKKIPDIDGKNVFFAGFNALTKAEMVIITLLVGRGAQVVWDCDAYYMDDKMQEAGQFMRQYRDHPAFSKSLAEKAPSMIRGSEKKISLTGVPQRVGQAKLAGKIVAGLLPSLPKENLAAELSKTVIVLPDEAMLLPVLHSLPVDLEDINVTMGFPLRETPLFSLLDLVIEMQLKARKNSFSHREVSAILGHAYFLSLAPKEALSLRYEIVSKNRVYVSANDLKGESSVFQLLFRVVDPLEATTYLLEIVQTLGAGFTNNQSFDREYAYHFHQHLSRLDSILQDSGIPEWRGFQKLFRQVISSQRIPFTGEPLRGLQIMGVLETRNLDFENVIFLSLNEGQLPAASSQGSYIPHAVRKAYALPTNDHRDAIYAYLFYRLLQRPRNVHLFFNTEPDIIGNGEMSRYVQQLLLESSLSIERSVLHNEIHVHKVNSIEVPKTPAVLDQLSKYFIKSEGVKEARLSPSSLNDYLDCSLRFYLKHVARLTEVDEVNEDVDARVFGNIIHDAAFWFYEALSTKNNGRVEPADIEKGRSEILPLIDRAFRELYKLRESEEVIYEGQRIVVREVAKTFLSKILEKDSEYAPFDIVMLEGQFMHEVVVGDKKIRIGGKIDRADRKDGVVRVIDYKTGKDEPNFESVEALFARDEKRNKAAFQTFWYAYVYWLDHQKENDIILPGLLNRKNLFSDFVFGHSIGNPKKQVENAVPLLGVFGAHLQLTVKELFDEKVPFQQTTYEKNCEYCAYKSMCRR